MLEVNEKTIESLQKVVENLLLNMGIQNKMFTKIVESEGKEIIGLNIETEEANLLIGEHGSNLAALQHLARILFARTNNNEIVPFVIDINNYKTEKERYLKNLAKSLAEKVKVTKKESVLPPMKPYERRIIHLFLSSDQEIVTQSEGEEPYRKIIIKLAAQK